MAEKGHGRSTPMTPSPHYTIGVIDWRLAYKNAIQTRNSLGMQDNGDMIKDKAACARIGGPERRHCR